MSSYLIPSSGTLVDLSLAIYSSSCIYLSARRNERGQLEPDAPEDVVQESLGFGGYEHSLKHPERKSDPGIDSKEA